jgi:hypothetical protein
MRVIVRMGANSCVHVKLSKGHNAMAGSPWLMEVAPCMKDGFPQSSRPDQGEIREPEQVAKTFSAAC